MAMLNISKSARAVNKNRTTIYRYIEQGKLSAKKNTAGIMEIDTSELLRVFGELATDGDNRKAIESNTVQQVDVEILLEQLESAQEREKVAIEREAKALEREEWLQKQLESALEHNKELERKMLPPAEPEEVSQKGFWARLLGK